MHVGTATKFHAPGRAPALPRTPHADHVAKLVTGMPDAKVPQIDRKIQDLMSP